MLRLINLSPLIGGGAFFASYAALVYHQLGSSFSLFKLQSFDRYEFWLTLVLLGSLTFLIVLAKFLIRHRPSEIRNLKFKLNIKSLSGLAFLSFPIVVSFFSMPS